MIRTKPSTPAYRDGWERAFGEDRDLNDNGTCPYPIEVGCTKECGKKHNCSSYIGEPDGMVDR